MFNRMIAVCLHEPREGEDFQLGIPIAVVGSMEEAKGFLQNLLYEPELRREAAKAFCMCGKCMIFSTKDPDQLEVVEINLPTTHRHSASGMEFTPILGMWMVRIKGDDRGIVFTGVNVMLPPVKRPH